LRDDADDMELSIKLARDVVEELLLQLGRLGSRVNRRALLSGLEACRAALDALEHPRAEDDARVELFDAARGRLVEAIDALAEVDVPDAERVGRRLIAVERSLERGRAATIDALVARAAHGVSGERNTGAQVTPFLAASLG
jgi:anti-sigma factor RsiW